MREIFIKYNPYRLETSITIDGAAPKQNSRLNFGDRRLQEWIEELPDIYKSAADLLEEYRKKLSELAQDVNVGNISIDPFELMAGDISGLSKAFAASVSTRRKSEGDC